ASQAMSVPTSRVAEAAIRSSTPCRASWPWWTAWPGEPPIAPEPEREIANRDEDFAQFVLEDITARRRIQRQVA
ncbi:MAG: hypothetical protein ACRDSE_14605, partial [Pseudonocardiaceae bacterium]